MFSFLMAFCITVSMLQQDLQLPKFSRRGPTCGIRSLYVAMKSIGVQVEYEDLISTKYVGSPLGSSASELIAAAKSKNCVLISVSHFSSQDLLRIRRPVLLHMRSSGRGVEFDHWVTYLGTSNGKIRVFDPSFGYSKIKCSELMANWSGSGLVLGAERHSKQVILRSKIELGVLILGVFLCLKTIQLTLQWFNKRSTTRQHLTTIILAQSLAIVSVSAILSCTYHFVLNTGFVNNQVALAEVVRRYARLQIPELKRQEVKKLFDSNASNIRFIDSRLSSDFETLTIAGALSIPANSSLATRVARLRNIQKEAKLIVFCQSDTCSYSDEIAQFLVFNGYENTFIYRGGFEEWIRKD